MDCYVNDKGICFGSATEYSECDLPHCDNRKAEHIAAPDDLKEAFEEVWPLSEKVGVSREDLILILKTINNMIETAQKVDVDDLGAQIVKRLNSYR